MVFKPWLGSLYGKEENIFGGKRVLVVGESHHADEHEVGTILPNMTQKVMDYYASGSRASWMRTLDNHAWAVSGKSRADLEQDGKRGEFNVWTSMAFYNYILVVLAGGPRSQRPTPELFKSGKAPFEQVFMNLKPELLLIWGYGLFPWIVRNHFPEFDGNPWHFKGEFIDLPTLPPVRAVRMLHPSAAFSSKHWHTVLTRALKAHGSNAA